MSTIATQRAATTSMGAIGPSHYSAFAALLQSPVDGPRFADVYQLSMREFDFFIGTATSR